VKNRNSNSKNCLPSHLPTIPSSRSSVAFLWDESFLWGVMAYKALEAAGLSFDLVRSEDIRKGRLREYAMLFVPGGWASNKLTALRPDGVNEIKRFVHDGGAYLGFCGGAGLATLDGIGLVPVKRKPTKERVPSFNGRIQLDLLAHPLWDGITEPIFHAWWPSQFVIERGSVSVLASYDEAMPDSFSSDVNVGTAETSGKWTELERIYQINLDPRRLLHDPAVIEGTFGTGKVILSLIHFDTPDDKNGAAVLRNLWNYLCDTSPMQKTGCAVLDAKSRVTRSTDALVESEAAVTGLIDLGLTNSLWSRRGPFLLQWKRGVRGLEYCTLFIMIRELAEMLKKQGAGEQEIEKKLEHIRGLLLPFIDKAKRLLLLERSAMQQGHITYETCDDPEVQALREELFSRSKSHGGPFKTLIDAIDGLLFRILNRG
jgi:hypothetical protein